PGAATPALAGRVVTTDLAAPAPPAPPAASARAAGDRGAPRGAPDVEAELCDDSRLDSARAQLGAGGVAVAAAIAGWSDSGTHLAGGS
ncbi:hybrid sensor histidine kinase/response regulator, partial [Burkholderia pseudomallei]